MQKSKIIFTFIISLIFSVCTYADINISMNLVTKEGVGSSVGTIDVKEAKYGVLFIPHLHGLPPGLHGFHIHQNPNCGGESGANAGGHLDPNKTGKHLGPYNDQGHLGDLPSLFVDSNGNAERPVLAPRLKLSDLHQHSLMIHQGGDNYSDSPEPLGGGGPRVACGIIK